MTPAIIEDSKEIKDIDAKALKNKLLVFTKSQVIEFLAAHPDEVFYAFAFDCNAECAAVHLSFNTEDNFSKTLKAHQEGRFGELYRTNRRIYELKYNAGHFQYGCFSSLNVLSEKELDKVFDTLPKDNFKSWERFSQKLLELFTEVLIQYSRTPEFEKIPKTNEFKFFCIDHNEDIQSAEARLVRLSG